MTVYSNIIMPHKVVLTESYMCIHLYMCVFLTLTTVYMVCYILFAIVIVLTNWRFSALIASKNCPHTI